MAAKPTFAPLPVRAIRDERLAGLDLRVLAAIAFHDRLSRARKNGQGCWASNKTLAQEINCNYTNLSSSITKLGELGYIEREPHPLNKHLRVLRVLYEADEEPPTRPNSGGPAIPLAGDGQTSHTVTGSPPNNNLPMGKVAFANGQTAQSNVGARDEASEPEEVCQPNSQAADLAEKPQLNIFRETGNRFPRREERDSAEAASSQPNVGATLAILERRLKHGAVPGHEMDTWEEWLGQVVLNTEDGDPNNGRAQRLLDSL